MDNLTLSFVHSRFYKGKRTQLNKSRFLVESGLVKGSLVIENSRDLKGDMVNHKILVKEESKKLLMQERIINLQLILVVKKEILSSFVEKA